jgi:hypothetical protein
LILCQLVEPAARRRSRYRLAGIDPNDIRGRKVETEVRLTGADRVRRLGGRCRSDMADIGEAFRAQQLLGNV